MSARRNTDRTIQANRELAEYQYSKDLEMWNRNNEYNSPQAQMARLQEAGLNPNLVYGSGAVANTSGQMPRYNAPNVQYNYKPIDIPTVLGAYQDFQVKQAQIDNLKAQTQNTDAKTITEAVRAELVKVQGDKTAFDLETGEMLRPYTAQGAELDTRIKQKALEQSVKKLVLMDHDALLKQLVARYKEKQLTAADLLNEKTQAENLFLQYRNEWMKQGVTTSDNPVLRIIIRMMNESGIPPDQIMKQGVNWLKELF